MSLSIKIRRAKRKTWCFFAHIGRHIGNHSDETNVVAAYGLVLAIVVGFLYSPITPLVLFASTICLAWLTKGMVHEEGWGFPSILMSLTTVAVGAIGILSLG